METSAKTQQHAGQQSSNNMKSRFIDGFLWIGESYEQIECKSNENCAKKGRTRCFVHEAEWRGISRKISHVPRWAIPGKSKIFLVHRGGSKARHKGKIFGFFYLARVEILSSFKHPASSPDVEDTLAWSGPAGQGRLTVTVYDSLSGRQLRGMELNARQGDSPSQTTGVEKHGRYILDLCSGQCSINVSLETYGTASLEGVIVPDGRRRNVDIYLEPQPKKITKLKEKCWDGTEATTHIFADGHWKPTDEKCPDLPSPKQECKEGAIKWEMCDDGTAIPAEICRNGTWIDTGASCPNPDDDGDSNEGPTQPPGNGGGVEVDIGNEVFALHRSCSLRLRPKAVYVVDALAAEITDKFSAELGTHKLRERYLSAQGERERNNCVIEGREIHRKVIEEILSTGQSRGEIDPIVQGKANLRGSLVLFKQPVTFVKHPTASFRSLECIDGEDLLRQIAEGVSSPTIRIWTQPAKTASMTRSKIERHLAGKLQLSLASIHCLLDVFADLAKEELGRRKAFKLPGIGTLRVTDTEQGRIHRQKPITKPEIIRSLLKYLERRGFKAGGRIPQLSQSVVQKSLDEISRLISEELCRQNGALRLPQIGTFRSGKRKPRFTPAKALGVSEKMIFEPLKKIVTTR